MDMREQDREHIEEGANDQFHNPSSYNEEDDRSQPLIGDGASPGKIFVGGLARETTPGQFIQHFEKYGEITDSVIMKDRRTGQPRGFGFITYADSSVVDKVIDDTHIINGKQVEIKRTIPKGAIGSKDFRTKKIFVGGIPTSVTEDEFREFFAKFGDIREHQIMRDHSTNRSRGFGFVTFDDELVVDNLLSGGNRIEFAGTKVEIKKAEPKKPNAPPPMRRYSDTRSSYGGGFGDSYGGGYGGSGGGFGPSSYRAAAGAYGGRSAAGAYGGYGSGDFGGYGGYGGSAMGGGGYRGAESYGYMSRYGGGAGYGSRGGYDIGGSAGSYGAGADGYGGYGGAAGGAAGYGGSYFSGFGAGGPMYGTGSSRGGYGGGGSGTGRFHPYGR